MMKKEKFSRNYLEQVPIRCDINWSENEEKLVTIEIKNTGIFNKIAQRLLKKPKVSYVHLDKFGSYIWKITDGKKNIIEIGKLFDKKFSEEAQPLYPRLAKYFQILNSYNFIRF